MVQVGDIVIVKKDKEKISAVVTSVEGDYTANLLFADGTHGWRILAKVKETGRHIDVESFLRQIQ